MTFTSKSTPDEVTDVALTRENVQKKIRDQLVRNQLCLLNNLREVEDPTSVNLTQTSIDLKPKSKMFSALDEVTSRYYLTIQDNPGQIISFDSGQNSYRRRYVKATLNYLINVLGKPTIVLSTVSAKATKSFLNLVPEGVKSKVLNLGLFHLYLNLLQKNRDILELLFVSKNYRGYLDMYFHALRCVQTDLLAHLCRMGITVILDRSIISNALYSKATGNNWSWSQVFDLSNFKPGASFFVYSKTDNDLNISNTKIYDSIIGINYTLRNLLTDIKIDVPSIVELEDYDQFDYNMEKIKKLISSNF